MNRNHLVKASQKTQKFKAAPVAFPQKLFPAPDFFEIDLS